jgi:carboxypeptidase C (cathepsin A)
MMFRFLLSPLFWLFLSHHQPSSCTASSLLSKEDYRVIGLGDIQPAFSSFHGSMFAGRIPTNHLDGKLMFWLYESSSEPASSSINKLTIWLNGGPGCSSFGGMLFENAPVTIPHYESGKLHSPTSPPFVPNEYSWTQQTHMLYVEQPAGTGFSSGPMPQNETDVANDFYGFLTNFYAIFPHLVDYDLHIFGESYAGMYVPSIARTIHLNNVVARTHQIPIKGIALGNGWIDATVQGPIVIDYAWWHGMIDLQTKEALHEQFQACLEKGIAGRPPFHKFNTPDECGTLEAVQAAAGNGVLPNLTGPNIYDVTTWDSYPFIFDPNGTFVQFFNSRKVQEMIHAPDQDWNLCLPGEGRRRRRLGEQEEEKMLDQDRPVSVVPYLAELLDDAKIRVLIYNGDRDMSCCSQGSELLLNQMKWSGHVDWKSAKRGVWLVNGEPAGYSRSTKNLEFVVVYNSGHLFPMNQPVTALDLVRRMVNGESFLDAELPTFDVSKSTLEALSIESSDAAGDESTNVPEQPIRIPQHDGRRHLGLLILISLVVGFAGGVFFTRHVEIQRRRHYTEVPDAANGFEVSTSQYPWRWWTSHHAYGGGGQRRSSS